MIAIEDPIYYSKLFARYERIEARRTGQRQWLDGAFYVAFEEWLLSEYKCWVCRVPSDANDSTLGLRFENEHDCTLFFLKFQHNHTDDLN